MRKCFGKKCCSSASPEASHSSCCCPPDLDLQSLEGAQQTIRQKSEDVRGYLDDANDQTVGRLVRLRADHMPTVRKYDKM